jgi:hypothetical protein
MKFYTPVSRPTVVASAIFIAIFFAIPGQTLPLSQLTFPETAATCFVQAGARDGGIGTNKRPYDSLADVEADAACEVIFIKMSRTADLALDGGIRLKDGQKLFGLGPDVTRTGELRERRPLITNTNAEDEDFFGPANFGAGVILANDNEVAGVHIDATHNAAIWAANISGAHIHQVLITNANSSSDPVQQNITGGAAAAINIYAAPFVGSMYIGPSADTSVRLEDSIIRGGQLGVQQTSEAQTALLTISGLAVAHAGPNAKSLATAQPVGAVSSLAIAGGQAKMEVHNSWFLEIDNLNNNSPVVSALALHDDSRSDLEISASAITNTSPMSAFDPLQPRGDGITTGAFAARANYSITNVTVLNAGQDGFEALAYSLGPSAGGSPPRAYSQAATVSGTLNSLNIENAGRFGVIAVLERQSEDAAPLSKVGLKMARSSITGSGSVDSWDESAGVAVFHADRTGKRPVSPGEEWNIDLGTAGKDTGINRILDNHGPDILIKDVGTSRRPFLLNASRNWWGDPENKDLEWFVPSLGVSQPAVAISKNSIAEVLVELTLNKDPIGTLIFEPQ